MNIPEQGQLVCGPCGLKSGYKIPVSAIWHYATCIKCHTKHSVTAQVKPDER
ncbi:hypothetical protein [Herbaspirillum rhizosphaerae]|uniref:hypothetical protein n=1 Tax=Herbaspirillum rhizosphaerae TaxID=346179 RepID=UPI000A3DB6A8|nr:hypothetical protein [Herbaspirillum rhizosphaerae]